MFNITVGTTLELSVQKNRGFVLILTLVFVLVLSLLSLVFLQTALLESKMASAYKMRQNAFWQAENELLLKEQNLVHGVIAPDVTLVWQSCGVKIYRVPSSVDLNGAQVKLMSTYALVDANATCHPKPKIKSGRKSWIYSA